LFLWLDMHQEQLRESGAFSSQSVENDPYSTHFPSVQENITENITQNIMEIIMEIITVTMRRLLPGQEQPFLPETTYRAVGELVLQRWPQQMLTDLPVKDASTK